MLDLTTRKFNQAGKALNVGISAGNGDEIDHHSSLLGQLTNFVIELCRDLIVALHVVA